MSTKDLLSTPWDPGAFMLEFLSVYTLVFFIFLWILWARLLQKSDSKLFVVGGYIVATFLMYFLPWAASYYISPKPTMPLGNPMFVILQSILQGYDYVTQTVHPILTGTPYLIGGQMFGGILGFLTFVFIFLLVKKFFSSHSSYGPTIKDLKMPHFFRKKDDVGLIAFTIKEIILIAFFISTVPFFSYFDKSFYQISTFMENLIKLVPVWIILFSASFFGFFAFHIIFPTCEFIGNTHAFIMTKIAERKGYEYNAKIATKPYLISVTKYIVVIILSIVIPILIAYTVIAISKGFNIQRGF